MDPADLVLLLASDETRPERSPYPLDRLRMQKAVFLVSRRGNERLASLYGFVPYNWGPYSGKLAGDLEQLTTTGDLVVSQPGGVRHGQFEASPTGQAQASWTWAQLTAPEQEFLRSVRAYVCTRSFNHLLREVYAAYPEFAVNSRFTG